MIVPRACVIGWPVAHSRSPLIHGFWLKGLGLSGCYDKRAVEPDDFPAFIAGLQAAGYVGGNVTIPHKQTAARLCARLTPAARRLGAVNTIWFEGAALVGDNTDGGGFLAALDQEVPEWARGRRAIVLGAGGAARGIVDALLSREFATVLVANRSPERAADLVGQLADRRCEAVSLTQAEAAAARTDLLVNTTSAGMSGQPDLDFELAALPPHAVVNDIVYVPRETALLRRAASLRLRTVGGLGMLLHQAVPGFERWFGLRPVVTPELRAVLEADLAAAQK